jgi:hypothetical protein
MIERVARALSSADGADPDGYIRSGIDAPHWMSFVEDAKAAIAAMRSMTNPMRSAANLAGSFDEAWEMAIDAALKK